MSRLAEYFDALLSHNAGNIRYTQNSPILYDVWMECALNLGKPHELLLIPDPESTAFDLAKKMRLRLGGLKKVRRKQMSYLPDQKHRRHGPQIACNETSVVATLYFHEIVQVALPLTRWWSEDLLVGDSGELVEQFMMDKSNARSAIIHSMMTYHAGDQLVKRQRKQADKLMPSEELAWLALVIGSLALIEEMKIKEPSIKDEILFGELWAMDYHKAPEKRFGAIVDALFGLLAVISNPGEGAKCLWKVNRNRRTESSVFRSSRTVKADAVQALFDVRGKGVRWAVIDSGIDATHIAFRRRNEFGTPLGPLSIKRAGNTLGQEGPIVTHNNEQTYEYSNLNSFNLQGEPNFSDDQLTVMQENPASRTVANFWGAFVPELTSNGQMKDSRFLNQTRVLKTYDFTRLREWLGVDKIRDLPPSLQQKLAEIEKRERKNTGMSKREVKQAISGNLRKALKFGQMLDWELIAKLLEVHHDDTYQAPKHHHGTHVAGIIGADWKASENGLSPKADRLGIAPEIEIYDLRALNANGEGDEFTLLAAMQFVRSLNTRHTNMQIHGVNLSFSIHHKVTSYACGRTPICEEAERLVGNGVVVVAAAGNSGRTKYLTTDNAVDEGYRNASITDPGNTQAVITVGSTHHSDQHNYGVSYFSSRGPTGDGRLKPDLVAPGEQIYSTVPDNGEAKLDGTSMAAPHVSGAAALLIQRNMELIGHPEKIKKILCGSATDLGRERYYQGAGALDILRALQSI